MMHAIHFQPAKPRERTQTLQPTMPSWNITNSYADLPMFCAMRQNMPRTFYGLQGTNPVNSKTA
jgi:hypothetical protein